MNRELPGKPDDWAERRARRMLLSVLIVIFMFLPAIHLLGKHNLTASDWLQLSCVVPFVGLLLWRVNTDDVAAGPLTWLTLGAIVVLGLTLFIAGGQNGTYVTALAISSAICGRYSRTRWPTITVSAICAMAGIAVGTAYHSGFGGTFSAAAVGPLGGFLAYSAARRGETTEMLRRTRAELARAAVAEERLRIARDLHDLLGHSLSLITLKAELVGRLIPADPERAAAEVAELESVARQSLSDVRGAVAGFRQPDLAGELVAARQLLDAAGIASHITSAGIDGLPRDVDAALAWAVREGTTNVVRHSKATQVSIRVGADPAAVTAEISDNGPAVPADLAASSRPAVVTAGPDGRAAVQARPVFAGSGLAGLAERVRSLGGELAAGSVEPQGFLLRVVVPLSPQA
ncbi:MAG TPA: sensor histidine kinase [Streptosporangiaceae bacterium]|nr:sensor histidine kinase [Streptosporangiaceae bacterium]